MRCLHHARASVFDEPRKTAKDIQCAGSAAAEAVVAQWLHMQQFDCPPLEGGAGICVWVTPLVELKQVLEGELAVLRSTLASWHERRSSSARVLVVRRSETRSCTMAAKADPRQTPGIAICT
jgi:hypothetical protein